MTRASIDQLCREVRMRKRARLRMIRNAFCASPFVLLQCCAGAGFDLVAVIHEATDAGWLYRVTYFDDDGPRGHAVGNSHTLLYEHVADWYPQSVQPMTCEQADAWLRERGFGS